MNSTPDTATAGNGGDFDPQQAAALLSQTTQRARRQFEPFPPWLSVIRGFMALIAYGAIWLSVRGQHPYTHPTAAAIPAAIAFGVVNVTVAVVVAKHATAGVSGRSRLRPAEIAVMATIWLCLFVVLGLLAGAGVSDAIVYGLYPATAPLIVVGLAWAGIMAARADWPTCATGLAVAAVGAVAAFAGPVGTWAVAGLGLFVVLLGRAAIVTWRQRA